MIYEEKGEFIIFSSQVWRPGVYKTYRAAKYAFRFKDTDLDMLQKEKNKTNEKVITFEDLQKLYKQIKIN